MTSSTLLWFINIVHIILSILFQIQLTTGTSIAIVGGGVGGTGTAYFLNTLGLINNDNSSLNVYLYEKTSRIGGRTYSTEFNNKKYEAGGSIIHSRNQLATELLNRVGLSKQKPSSLCSSNHILTGIYDGDRCVFKEDNNSLITLYRFLRNYGFNLFRLHQVISSTLDSFDSIYMRLAKGQSFKSVKQMLTSMDVSFVNLTEVTLYDHLVERVIEEKIIEELVNAATLVNYGQSSEKLHAFVGLVALAGIDVTGNLWSIEGGNELLAQRMAKASKANVIKDTEVVKITLNSDQTYTLTDSRGDEKKFDVVVLAHPLAKSEILFQNLTKSSTDEIEKEREKSYHRTIATFVSGKKRLEDDFCGTSDVLICKDNYTFQSVAVNLPVDRSNEDCSLCGSNCSLVYKVFSPQVLKKELIETIFTQVDDVQIIKWDAYPEYKIGLIDKGEGVKFELNNGLYHLNAIEWAASAIEMSLIGAKNVALLTRDYLRSRKLIL